MAAGPRQPSSAHGGRAGRPVEWCASVTRLRSESGQALLLVVGLAAVLMLGTLVLAGFGQALGGKARHQRGADLAAVSAARSMQADYPRLFEAAILENGVPNPRHLSGDHFLARARAAAVRAGPRNRVRVRARDVSFPPGFAPTRVSVRVRGDVQVRVAGSRRGEALRRVVVR
ncbi:MAG: pilus assembly protein TadG-related protein, partial [Actinomycetota bacterium]